MINTHNKIIELMQVVNALTDDIADKISHQLFDHLDNLLAQRQRLISELVAEQTMESEIIKIRDFIAHIHDRDQGLMQSLKDHSDVIKHSLMKVNKLKHYVT